MILFFLILLLLLSSKMMLFNLLIGGFIYIYKNKNIKIYKAKSIYMVVIIFFIIGISSITLTKRFLFEKDTRVNEIITKKEFGNSYPWTGSSIRLLQLRILKEQIEEDNIFWRGFGLFASRQNVKERHQEFDTYYTFHNYNYHNQYAQILSETGVFGLILLLAMILTAMIKAIRTNNFLFIMFCVTTTMIFFTESLLWRQQGLFVFTIFYCLIVSINLNKKALNSKIIL
ncbi:O-antigen ligase family protein [Gaetbulibacter aquiaggeris]|uniref:O-antigen ligase family protein n=1 Tax=Gaetbulibacter aquiaggeris TaxID=1735373 RepID=A0ABW7MQB5_9FLAO